MRLRDAAKKALLPLIEALMNLYDQLCFSSYVLRLEEAEDRKRAGRDLADYII